MTHDEAFLADIVAEPDDDAPRLVYADYLDEHGQGERAEFIRVQCALASGAAPGGRVRLEARERELLGRYGAEWARPLSERVSEWAFRRGFIEEVHVEARTLLAGAEELFRLAPLRHLHLSWSFVRPYQRARLMPVLTECPQLAHLSSLDLSGNSLGSDGVEALAVCGHLTHLTSLDLGDNRVGDRGVRALVHSPLLARLVHLDLSHNDIGPRGVRSLAVALGVLAAREQVVALHTLDLSGNKLGEAGRRAIGASAVLRRVARW